MPSATAVFADAYADMLSALGVDTSNATVQRGAGDPVPVSVVVHDGVARVGEYGRVIGRNTTVDFLRSEWQPMRGDLVTLDDGTSRKVDEILTDDGIVVTVVLHG